MVWALGLLGGSGGLTVDDINPALNLRTLNYWNCEIFLIMGSAGFISSTVVSLKDILIGFLILISLLNTYLLSPPTLQVGSPV